MSGLKAKNELEIDKFLYISTMGKLLGQNRLPLQIFPQRNECEYQTVDGKQSCNTGAGNTNIELLVTQTSIGVHCSGKLTAATILPTL
jgi:hypothetical protein